MDEENSLDWTPYPAGKILVEELDDFFLGFNVNSPNVVVMDNIGKELLELCDGKRKAREIIECLHLKHPRKAPREELSSFMDSLVKNGFLLKDATFAPIKPTRFSGRLHKLYVNITHACNLRCKYCYIDAGENYENELSEEEFISQIEEFGKLNGEEITITGGEPFLRKKVLTSIIKTARNFGVDAISIETNGTLIDKKDAEFCKENNVRVCVGLGGATLETHDKVRGKGFNEAIKGTTNLINAGVDTAIGMTITRTNIHEAQDFLRLAKKLGAKTISLNIVTNVGRAREHPELDFPLEDALPIVDKVMAEGQRLGVKTAFETTVLERGRLPSRNLCGAGTDLLSLAANGDVYPCNSFQGTRFKAGNVREHSLSEIWKGSEVLKMFRKLDISDVPMCRDCEWRYMCGAGCIAQTFHAYGTLERCSPHCMYYKQMYSALLTRLARQLWNES